MRVVIFNKEFESKCRHMHKRYAKNGHDSHLLRQEADEMKNTDVETSNQFLTFLKNYDGSVKSNNNLNPYDQLFTTMYIAFCVVPLCEYINHEITFDDLVSKFTSLCRICHF
jgi:hypothetical protein